MRKFFITVRSKIPGLKLKLLGKRKVRLQMQLVKVEADINSILFPTITLAISMIPGYRSNPPKEKRFKTLCSKCYNYYFFEPSAAMLRGENIAFTNCTHCNQELVSFVSPELETGKEAVSWLKSEHKEKVKELNNFVLSLGAQLGIDLSDKKNEKTNFELLYKKLLDNSNTGGLLN